MGLDTTHDCWSGPYSAFYRFRKAVAATIGIDLDRMVGFFQGAQMPDGSWAAWDRSGSALVEVGPPMSWDGVIDPLKILLDHSDCDGLIEVADCLPLAERLESVSPLVAESWRPAVLRFAKGLRAAHAANEPVEFH